jgi:hypothetical protein
MTLVNELQISAEQDDVMTVLRKTKRLAAKLGRQDIADWLKSELEGYPSGSPVPEFRQIGTSLAYNTNGYIPVGGGRLESGVKPLPDYNLTFPFSIRDPISTIMSWIDDANNIYHQIPLNSEYGRTIRSCFRFHPMFADQISFLLHLNGAQLTAVPECIKDRVLDWACALEQAGVHGDNMTFDDREKHLADSVRMNLVFNQTNNNVGDVNNQIQAN